MHSGGNGALPHKDNNVPQHDLPENTQPENTQGDKKPRGILLLDTNILFSLYASVPPDYKSEYNIGPRPRRYLDMLAFLSKQGYEVVIPEMVAYEAENILTSGKDVDSFFPRADHTRARPPRRDLKKFLLNAINGDRYPNVQIVPNDSPQHVAEFLNAVHSIVDNEEKPSPYITNLLVSLHRNNRQHYGDHAIEAMLEDPYGIRNTDVPLYVVSDDHDVLQNASRYKNISVTNTMGFMDAMLHSGMWEGMGLDKAKAGSAHDIVKGMDEQLMLLAGEVRRPHSRNVDLTAGEYDKTYVNQQPASNTQKHPFASSVAQLITDLGWRKQVAELNSVLNEETIPATGMEKFVERYGEDWREKHRKREQQKEEGQQNGHQPGGSR